MAVRGIGAVLLAVGLLGAGTACSSSKAPQPGTSSGPATTASSSSSTGGAATTVTVTEKEYSLSLSQSRFTPGTYTFVANNKGSTAHALQIAGPGAAARVPNISPGSTAQFTVTLQEGSYELWCPVDDHKALGMDTHIQVAAGG